MAKRPQVGDEAPDFDLEGTEGPFRLSDHRSECRAHIVRSWEPAAWWD
jgi:peroxiredoxin